MLRAAQDRSASGDSFMAEVPDFQPDRNEKIVFLVIQQKERKELARIHEVERTASIENYRWKFHEVAVGKSKGGP